MPCARVPGTRLSTPPPAPGRPPAAATLISPGGNLKKNIDKEMFFAAVIKKTPTYYTDVHVYGHLLHGLLTCKWLH